MEKINTISTYCDSKGRTTRRCFHARGEFGVVIIGDYQCQRCEYFRGKNETARTISCSHPDGHPVAVYATDEELRERWRHINLLKIEADTMFDEEDNVEGVKVWSVAQAKEIAKEILSMEKKKMTKAEAFEYLKGKKVNAKDKDRVVQMKMFDCGIKWRCGESVYYNFGSYLFIDNEGFLLHCGNDEEYWERHAYKEISADDILSIEIVEDKYELEFNYDKVVELAKPLMHHLNEVGCRDSIRVSQFGIVHEPMSTLIFDNGIGE